MPLGTSLPQIHLERSSLDKSGTFDGLETFSKKILQSRIAVHIPLRQISTKGSFTFCPPRAIRQLFAG